MDGRVIILNNNKMDLIQKQLAFFNDTVEYYKDGTKRCYSENYMGCSYSPKTSNRVGLTDGCAIGRHLTDELKEELDKDSYAITEIAYSEKWNKIPESLKELRVEFLAEMQLYHDAYLTFSSENKTKKENHIRKCILEGLYIE